MLHNLHTPLVILSLSGVFLTPRVLAQEFENREGQKWAREIIVDYYTRCVCIFLLYKLKRDSKVRTFLKKICFVENIHFDCFTVFNNGL